MAYTTDLAAKITDSGVIDCSISDHAFVYVIRRAKALLLKSPIKTIRYRSFKTYSVDDFTSDLHDTCWDFIDTSLTVEDAWVSFKETLITLIEKHTPIRLQCALREFVVIHYLG